MKRIALFLGTNLAVLIVLSVVLRLLGIDRWLDAQGFNYGSLLVFSLVIGFGGAFISLAMSKAMAKWTTRAQVIDGSEGPVEGWLMQTVQRLAERAGVGMPEVAIYRGAPNAFATGASRNAALVAVSSGLLETMSRDEIEAVLGHEITHVANGDMVTLTLIQGVVNTFVVFLSRIVGTMVDKAVFRTERGSGIGYFATVIACEIVFGVLASIVVAWFSRQREFRADAGSARLLGNPQPMVAALTRLGGLEAGALPQSFQSSGISGQPAWLALFASHPPLERRIAALQERQR